MEPTTDGLNELLMGSVHLQQLEDEAAPDEQDEGKEKKSLPRMISSFVEQMFYDVSIWTQDRGFLTYEWFCSAERAILN